LAWCALSLLASPEPFLGLPALSRWAAFAAFYALAASFWQETDRQWWALGLACGGTVLAAASFLIQIPGYPHVGLLPPYYNYTAFVEAALFCAALAAATHPRGPGKSWRTLAAALALLALAQIFFVHSRGGAGGGGRGGLRSGLETDAATAVSASRFGLGLGFRRGLGRG
jgi:hypothetical protein